MGREYLKTGYYSEIYFPQKDVRFIALNDNVDTDKGDNEFAPFKNIINEWYAKDVSRKVRSAYKTKGLNGEFLGARTPYGYMKSPDDKHKLIPDENAPIIQRMFAMALEGLPCYRIAKYLKNEHILTPTAYIKKKKGGLQALAEVKFPYSWHIKSVKSILCNPVYVGDTVNQKYPTKSFKNKTRILNPESEWIVVQNTHEPLVSREDFETVQKRLSVKKPYYADNPNNIFKGLVKCGNCGHSIIYKKPCKEKYRAKYECSEYVRHGKEACTPHRIWFNDLYNVVLDDIQRNIELVSADKTEYINRLTGLSAEKQGSDKIILQKEQDKLKKRLSEISKILLTMYEDKALNRISAERYASMAEVLEKEEAEIKERLTEMQTVLTKQTEQSKSAQNFADLIEQYAPVTKLDRAVLNTLIDKILIYENSDESGKNTISVEIYYRFIGKIS